MSSANPIHDVQIVSGDLSKSDHQRILRILFDPPAYADRGAGDPHVTRNSRDHDGEAPSAFLTPGQGATNSTESGANQVRSADADVPVPARPGSVRKGAA